MKKLFYLLLIVIITLIVKDCFSQWTQVGAFYGGEVSALTSGGANIIAGTSGNGIYISTNNGTNWSHLSFNNETIYALITDGSYIFAGAFPNIYRSTNNGLNWTTSLSDQNVYSLAYNGSNIFAGTASNGVYLSTNYGGSWSPTSLDSQDVFAVAVSGNNIYAGTYLNGLYKSTNNGSNWALTGMDSTTILSLLATGNYIFAGTYEGIYVSSNNGNNWQQPLINDAIRSFAINGINIFTSTDINGVYRSTDNGSSWIPKNQGFPDTIPEIFSLLIANNYIFAGVSVSDTIARVWRRSYSDIIGINNISSNIPEKYFLYQNYPNPFNPNTKIKYQITNSKYQKAEVTLIVYDIAGKEVATLVNEKQSPGIYEVTFDRGSLPSGIFFYRLTAGNFIETKKMVLIK